MCLNLLKKKFNEGGSSGDDEDDDGFPVCVCVCVCVRERERERTFGEEIFSLNLEIISNLNELRWHLERFRISAIAFVQQNPINVCSNFEKLQIENQVKNSQALKGMS